MRMLMQYRKHAQRLAGKREEIRRKVEEARKRAKDEGMCVAQFVSF